MAEHTFFCYACLRRRPNVERIFQRDVRGRKRSICTDCQTKKMQKRMAHAA